MFGIFANSKSFRCFILLDVAQVHDINTVRLFNRPDALWVAVTSHIIPTTQKSQCFACQGCRWRFSWPQYPCSYWSLYHHSYWSLWNSNSDAAQTEDTTLHASLIVGSAPFAKMLKHVLTAINRSELQIEDSRWQCSICKNVEARPHRYRSQWVANAVQIEDSVPKVVFHFG